MKGIHFNTPLIKMEIIEHGFNTNGNVLHMHVQALVQALKIGLITILTMVQLQSFFIYVPICIALDANSEELLAGVEKLNYKRVQQ